MPLSVDEFRGPAETWDGFVRTQPTWTHCHLYGWKTVMERALGHECLYLAAREPDGALMGVLPLVRVKSLWFGHYLVSMPFLNYGGPLGSDPAVRALVEHAQGRAAHDRVKLLELRSPTPLPVGLPVSHRKVAVLLDLAPGEPEAVWDGISPRLKSYVRRTQKAGVTVAFGADQIPDFYRVFAPHMRELGTPTHARRLFETIVATFPDDVWVGCARHGDQPVACGLALRWRDEIEVTWASALSNGDGLRPNVLLYWAFLERAAREGLRRFNFGRSTPGSGPHEFKRRWGGHDEALWWYECAASAGATTPSPESQTYALGVRLWKHLPLALTTALGPRIVRYLP